MNLAPHHPSLCSVAQSRLTFCNPMDCSWLASPVHAVFQEECWRELPFPSPGGLPNSGIEPLSPGSPAWQADSLPQSYWRSTVFLNTCFQRPVPPTAVAINQASRERTSAIIVEANLPLAIPPLATILSHLCKIQIQENSGLRF